VFAVEQAAQLGPVELGRRGVELRRHLGAGLPVTRFDRQLEQHSGVLERAGQAVEHRDLALDTALLAQDALGLLAAVPEVRASDLALERCEPRAQAVDVKDAPGARRASR